MGLLQVDRQAVIMQAEFPSDLEGSNTGIPLASDYRAYMGNAGRQGKEFERFVVSKSLRMGRSSLVRSLISQSPP